MQVVMNKCFLQNPEKIWHRSRDVGRKISRGQWKKNRKIARKTENRTNKPLPEGGRGRRKKD